MARISQTTGGGRPRGGRWLSLAGVAGLVLLGLAYALTYEPAPRIRVRWREDVTPQEQATLEKKYLLVNGRERVREGTLAYDLLDTRSSNIRALVEDPAVADTNDIERHTYVVPFDVDYGIAWMWVAHRTPILRDGRLRLVVIIILALAAVYGVATTQRKQGKPSEPNVPVG